MILPSAHKTRPASTARRRSSPVSDEAVGDEADDAAADPEADVRDDDADPEDPDAEEEDDGDFGGGIATKRGDGGRRAHKWRDVGRKRSRKTDNSG